MPQLPTYLIAGAMRCGTTSLNAYLREHPEISVGQPKEVHFFDENYERGTDWYLQHFPDSDESRAVGEATPSYLYFPEVAERIATTLPDVKILLLLRDPVERAHSHYWHNRSVGREKLDFAKAIASEPRRLEHSREDRARYSYLDRGRYGSQLENLLRFIPLERVLVQTFNELTSDPTTVYRRTCQFLGVADDYTPPIVGQVTNAYVEYRSPRLRDVTKGFPRRLRNIVALLNRKNSGPYEPMKQEAADLIRSETEEDNRLVTARTGIELPWLTADRQSSPEQG
ncbi:MAG: sulfotransferase [Acidimicrobiia bacterium]